MINWEFVATIAEVIGALGVIASLIYVARQLKVAHTSAADANRLTRATGVHETMLTAAANDELRKSVTKAYGFDDYYETMAADLNLSTDEAARADMHSASYFWLHWGQFASTTNEADLEELRQFLRAYTIPGFRYSWDNSPFAKKSMDPRFVEFVDTTLAEYDRESGR